MVHFELFEIKQRAWNTLRSCYWYTLLAFFVSYMLSAVASGVIQLAMRLLGVGIVFSFDEKLVEFENFINSIPAEILEETISAMSLSEIVELFLPVFQMWSIIVIISMALSFLMYVLASEQIMIGLRSNYMAMREGNNSLNGITAGFTGNYFNVVKVSAVKWLYIMIGGLLFVIPGIVLNYRYMMVQYLLAENPDMSPQRALSISRRMMKGNKFRMFLMQMTFMGWMILGAMACGIGVFFVMPYYIMAETEAYIELRNKAIENGLLYEYDLTGNTYY